ncbi:uncharacterized protein LOC118153158 [Callithrix jacchus]
MSELSYFGGLGVGWEGATQIPENKEGKKSLFWSQDFWNLALKQQPDAATVPCLELPLSLHPCHLSRPRGALDQDAFLDSLIFFVPEYLCSVPHPHFGLSPAITCSYGPLFLTELQALRDSDPSTLDSQSSTTLFLSSEEPGPSTAALPSPSSSSCEPQAFSPGPPVLPPLLPPLPAASAPPGPGTSRRAGLYAVVASSPEAAPRLVDWLPGCPSTTSPATRGDDRERPPPVLAPAQGPERSCALRPGAAGREEVTVDAGSSPPPRAGPAAAASLEANVGDILVELRTMNGHLDVIARALTKLASSLGPQPEPMPDAPDAD